MKKLLTITLFALIIFLSYSQKSLLLYWIEAGGSLSLLVSILFVAALVFFPVVPFIVVAGIIGSVFGVAAGTAICLAGSLLGTLIMFTMSRFGFQDWIQATLDKYPKAKEYESLFERNAFLSILLVRVVPVIPPPVVNILCGVSNVSWIVFTAATFLGKLPSIFLFNLAGSQFETNHWFSFSIYGAYFLVISLCAAIYLKKKQHINQTIS
ncbi:TVP38/TMEM64 family protein [Ammoniphilus sp. CFH 90114]|uniref:TVP38/TMEM64 family protein n=1 Tax=Ammoniphilus sp. CFH 90114 TaxID=2493665 RepID=UPI00100F332E|nr:VTT domain-containing protein [Ammoniphilus sp. CFH 90114]RXT04385.1 TVP38/TMEM64 family protein [Ammoniphilus sp. CFH 90114]